MPSALPPVTKLGHYRGTGRLFFRWQRRPRRGQPRKRGAIGGKILLIELTNRTRGCHARVLNVSKLNKFTISSCKDLKSSQTRLCPKLTITGRDGSTSAGEHYCGLPKNWRRKRGARRPSVRRSSPFGCCTGICPPPTVDVRRADTRRCYKRGCLSIKVGMRPRLMIRKCGEVSTVRKPSTQGTRTH